MNPDIIVVGSGLAGMRAAIAASEKGIKCKVISLVYPPRPHSVAAQTALALLYLNLFFRKYLKLWAE